MNSYPIFVQLHTIKCLIIGGGKIATRKVNHLIEQNGNITVISPEVTPEIEALKDKINILKRAYQHNDCIGFSLVFIATNQIEINKTIEKECIENNILFNNLSNHQESNFFSGAVITKKNIQIAFSTNGKTPYLSKVLKSYFENHFNEEIDFLIDKINEIRRQIIEAVEHQEEREKKIKIEIAPIIDQIIQIIENQPKNVKENHHRHQRE